MSNDRRKLQEWGVARRERGDWNERGGESRGVYETDAPESLRSAEPPSLATQQW